MFKFFASRFVLIDNEPIRYDTIRTKTSDSCDQFIVVVMKSESSVQWFLCCFKTYLGGESKESWVHHQFMTMWALNRMWTVWVNAYVSIILSFHSSVACDDEVVIVVNLIVSKAMRRKQWFCVSMESGNLAFYGSS